MGDSPVITLNGPEGIAYIQRMILKEAAYIRNTANNLPNNEEALRKPRLESADNIEYFAGCLEALKKGEIIDFLPPHPNHMDIEDYHNN